MEKRLGRGLGSLLGEKPEVVAPKDARELPVSEIRPNPYQPRKTFDPEALQELAESIRTHGVLQPVVVRRQGNGYELVAGERRWRASQAIGRPTIPAVVREGLNERDMLELALVENVQRQDLDAVERARGFQQMIEVLHLTQEQVAERVSLKRSTVANHLRLLELPDTVQRAIAKGLLTMGHARALLAVPGAKEQARWMERVVRDDLSVRQVEQLVRTEAEARRTKSAAPPPADSIPAWATQLEERMRRHLGTKVTLQNGPGYRGEIRIEYFSRADLERLSELLAPTPRL